MNAPVVSRLAAISTALLLAAGTASPAFGFLDFFKKDQKKAPSAAELQAQEAEATGMLREARSAESAGSTSKATGIYDSILKKFPFTNSAAEAAYSKALVVRKTGKLQPSFEAFQRLINDFRQSPRFADAIQQQYEIAEEAKGGKKQRTLIMVPMKLGAEEVIKMYKQVITNAPYGKFAPLSQFSIAEIRQDKGEKNEAVAAYQLVVDNYPASKEAAEAQYRIGAISNIAARNTQDAQNLVATRDALKTYITTNPTGDRSSDAQSMLTQVDEAQAARSLEIGKFYEKQGKNKAAAIYYNEALKFGNAEASEEARTRLSKLAATAPADVADTKRNSPGNDYTVPGAGDLRRRPDYAGPPSPELARLSQKPKMRKDNDQFLPIPMQEPALPTRPGDNPATTGNSLLPPPTPAATGEKPATPPVPTPPVPAPPVPPAPDAKKN